MSRFSNRVMDKSDEIVLPNYERIKVVGQGSFGVAVLYRKLPQKEFVVLKQIKMVDLNASEKELALNEVEVFSKLHHPNIISYIGNSTQNGVLLIEMEFADGGNLAQIISDRNQDDYFSERYVLGIFEQITSALFYIHSQHILHRDLKTANVFLNSKGLVKLGDFGISKIMNTIVDHAQTVLGTPYYFSPEMCEGKNYDDKSDIWALGCILVEMCCLRKAFLAANLAELISKIMTGQYSSLPSGYSDCLKSLPVLIFQVDSSKRPAAMEILKYWIPLIYRNLGPYKGFQYEHSDSTDSKMSDSLDGMLDETLVCQELKTRTVLYNVQSFGEDVTINAIPLPTTIQIDSVSSSDSHFLAVSSTKRVYVWGESKHGQLGNGNPTNWIHYPTEISALVGVNVISASAGNGFSIFLSEDGDVYSTGSNIKGCLGLGSEVGIRTMPKKIPLSKIKQIQCGSQHVLCLRGTNTLFSWGSNEIGALGLGEKTSCFEPEEVFFNGENISIDKIFCGPESSLFITNTGTVYACGSNSKNVLGFGGKVTKKLVFTKIPLPKKIVNLGVSSHHSAFITECGYVLTLGDNQYGQRGIGHTIDIESISLVTSIRERFVTAVGCNTDYCLSVSEDNILSVWGTRSGVPRYDGNSHGKSKKADISSRQSEICDNTVAFTNFLSSVYQSETILDPIDILALYSPNNQGTFIGFKQVLPLRHSILVLIETNCPSK